MNLIIFLLFTIFILWIGHFLFILKKVDFDFESALNWYQNKFFNKKNKKVNVNENKSNNKPVVNIKTENTIEHKIDLNEFNQIMPFKVETEDTLSEEERKLRAKLIEKVKKKPAYFIENGEKKIIMPLEAIVFLNNDFNPLTNENGEIIIRIKEENDKYKIYSEETGDVYLDPEDSNEDSIIMKELQNALRENDISPEDIQKLIKNKKSKENNLEENEEENKKDLEESLKLEKENEKNEEDLKSKKEKEKEEEKEEDFEVFIPEDILEDLDIESKENKKENTEEIFSMEDMLGTVEKELKEEEKSKDKDNMDISIKELLKNKKWESIEGASLDFKNIEESLSNLLENNLNMFLSNIVKHNNLIMNENKTGIFVDNMIIYNSLSRLFGNNYKTIISKFGKIPPRIFNSYKKSMEDLLGDLLYDINRDKRFMVSTFSNGDKCFKGFGLWFKVEIFQNAFEKNEDFDFFRSYPIEDKIKVKEGLSGCAPLVSGIDDIEI